MADVIKENKLGLALLGIALAVGMIGSAYLLTQTMERIKFSTNENITVKGYAEMSARSDLGKWRGSTSAFATTKADAYAKLEKNVATFSAFLTAKGVTKDEMTLDAISSSIRWKRNEKGRQTDQVAGYRLTQSIEVASKDVNKISDIARNVTSLLKDGLQVNSNNPEYYLDSTRLNDIKLKLISQATANAKGRAQAFAESGISIGTIKTARQGVFQVTPPNDSGISGYGRFDTSTIEKTVKSVVTVTYSIKPE